VTKGGNMDFSNDIEHPYNARYNWLIERFVNGDDRAEKAISRLCEDIKGYEMLHSECISIVKDYDGREK